MLSFHNSFFYSHLKNIQKVLCKSVMETRLVSMLQIMNKSNSKVDDNSIQLNSIQLVFSSDNVNAKSMILLNIY